MGNWSKHEFEREILPKRCYIFAGTAKDHIKESIINNYSEILFHLKSARKPPLQELYSKWREESLLKLYSCKDSLIMA